MDLPPPPPPPLEKSSRTPKKSKRSSAEKSKKTTEGGGSSKKGTLKAPKQKLEKSIKPYFGDGEQDKLGDSAASLGSWGGADLDQVFGKTSPLLTPGGRRKVRLHGSLSAISFGDSTTTFKKPSSSSGRRGSSETLATAPSESSLDCVDEMGKNNIPPPRPPLEKSSPTPKKSKRSSAEKSKKTTEGGPSTSPKIRKGRKQASFSEKKSSSCRHLGDDWGHLSLSDHQKSKEERDARRRHCKSPKAKSRKHQAGGDTSHLFHGDDDWGNLDLSAHNKSEEDRSRHSERHGVRKFPRSRRKQLVVDDHHSEKKKRPNVPPDPADSYDDTKKCHDEKKSSCHHDKKPKAETQKFSRMIKYIPASKPAAPKEKKEELPSVDCSGGVMLDGEECGQKAPDVISPAKSFSPSSRRSRIAMPSPRILLSKAAKSLSNRRYLPAFRSKDEVCHALLLDSSGEADFNSSAPDFYYKDLVDVEPINSTPKPSSMRNLRLPASSPLTSPILLRRGKKKPHNLLPLPL
jgi:hypothetical protein